MKAASIALAISCLFNAIAIICDLIITYKHIGKLSDIELRLQRLEQRSRQR